MAKKLLFLMAMSLFVFGCRNFVSDKSSSSLENSQWCTFRISMKSSSFRSAVVPKYDSSILYYTLTYAASGESEITWPEDGTAASYDDFTTNSFTLAVGDYNFTLKAYGDSACNALALSASLSQTLTSDMTGISFELTVPEEASNGSVSVPVSFPASANITSVSASLARLLDGSIVVDATELAITTSGDTCTVIYEASDVLAGVYILYLTLTATNGGKETTTVIPMLVKIASGVTSTPDATENTNGVIELDEKVTNVHYALTYENMTSGDGSSYWKNVVPASFVQGETVTLPTAESFASDANAIFAGWYEDADFTTQITSFTGESQAKTVYARWIQPVLYVSEDGSDSNDGLSSTTALASLGQAVAYSTGTIDTIRQTYASLNTVDGTSLLDTLDWTVYVSGAIESTSAVSITTLYANSLVIAGLNGLDSTGVPQDSLVYNNTAVNSVLSISGTTPITLQNIKIKGGYGYNGGGINNTNTAGLTLSSGVLITDNEATNGGGVYNAGKLIMTGGTISGNTADGCGGGIYNTGTLTISGGSISGNESTTTSSIMGGGGIYSTGSIALSGTASITENTATKKAGGIAIYGDGTDAVTLTISDDVVISKNESAAECGGIGAIGTALITMTGGTISENSATEGAGISLWSSAFTMSGGTISKNYVSGTSSGNGSGVCVQSSSSFTLDGGTVSENYAGTYVDGNGDTATTSVNGAGVYVDDESSFTLTSGTISSNTASSYGGGVYIGSTGTLTMTGGTISANTATSGGGGLASWGTTTLGESAYIPAGTDGKNDVFLYSGGSHTYLRIASSLTATTPVATLTPGTYVSGRPMIALSDDSTATLADEYEKFVVTQPSDGSYWTVDSTGLLQTVTGTLTVTISGSDDISVTVTAGGTAVSTDTPYSASAGTKIVFTADSGYSSYSWTVDDTAAGSFTGATVSSDGTTLTLDTTSLSEGTYDVVLEAADSSGEYYSFWAQVTVSE